MSAAPGVPDFVKKLYRMLEDTTYGHIVAWGLNGDTFVVKEPNEFAKTILPKHFKHSNFASFVRQLNKYDFHKIKNTDDSSKPYGEHAWEFQHPSFQHNKCEMLESIKRKIPNKNKPGISGIGTSMLPEDIRMVADDLQGQVNSVSKLQSDMGNYLQSMSKNYQVMVEEILSFRKSIIAQDQLLQNVVQYVLNQDSNRNREHKNVSENSGYGAPFSNTSSSADMLKLLNSYNELSKVSLNQVDDFSKRAQSLQEFASTSLSQFAVPMMNHVGGMFGNNSDDINNVNMNNTDLGGYSNNEGGFGQPNLESLEISLNQLENRDNMNDKSFPFGTNSMDNNGLINGSVGNNLNNSNGSNTQIKSNTENTQLRKGSFTPNWATPPKVLLVEDDAVCRRLSTKLLQIFGCSFDVATDGVAAVNKMNLEKYDIVLMDIVMPNLDGVSATTRIRQFDAITPIISMTSNTTENDCMTYLANGMNDILAKPFSKAGLNGMLEKYCMHLRTIRDMGHIGRNPSPYPALTNSLMHGNFLNDHEEGSSSQASTSAPMSMSSYSAIPVMNMGQNNGYNLSMMAGIAIPNDASMNQGAAIIPSIMFATNSNVRPADYSYDEDDHRKRPRLEVIE
ncbi:kinase-regulated stress-responsive transcription factor skn7 [Basidiobolus ranarum]|uniref:Transcription factor n=1 Tax=Basidiobolus ranarum TaxID=34480 RepID=A0ABR2X1T8_9FUNG